MIWFTADHHFGHGNIIQFCDRPFLDVGEMDSALISAWNDVVDPRDVVYHLGDFTLGSSLSPWIYSLNFEQLFIVPGGHDRRWKRRFGQRKIARLVEVLPPLVTLEFPSGMKYPHVLVLCHYPLLSWDRSHYGSIHLHGHSHGRIPGGYSDDAGPKKGMRIDVGVDARDNRPMSLEEVLSAAGEK